MADKEFDGIELSDEALEGIAGGVISQGQQDGLNKMLAGMKHDGLSKKDAIVRALHDLKQGAYPGVTQPELIASIDGVWAKL